MNDGIEVVKWGLGLGTAALTAVVVAWAVRRFGPAKEFLDSNVVKLTFSTKEIDELKRVFNAIPTNGSEEQRRTVLSILLTGWSGDRVINSGKPGTIYVLELQELEGVKTQIDRMAIFASPRFERPPHKQCVRLTMRATIGGIEQAATQNVLCLVDGQWTSQERSPYPAAPR